MRKLLVVFVFLGLTAWIAAESNRFTEMKKYALVTGASRGLGRAIVEALLEKDKEIKIFAVARGQEELDQLATIYPASVIPIVADIGEANGLEEIQKVVHSTLLNGGALFYLVHNAASIAPLGDLDYLQQQPLSTLLSVMDKSYRANVIAPHLLTLSLLPELKKAQSARVLFISSRAGDFAVPGAVTYSCTKAALDHLGLNLQASLPKEISFGLLIPGEVDTDMQADLRTLSETEFSFSSLFRAAKENNQLLAPKVSAQFVVHLLYETPGEEFSRNKWDIYSLRPSNFPEGLSKIINPPPPYAAK